MRSWERDYTPITVLWDNEECIPDTERLTPLCLYLEGGGIYEVDSAAFVGLLPADYSGGYGYMYELRTSCEDENCYGKRYRVYFEQFGKLGRWYCDDTGEYVAIEAYWDMLGGIKPKRILFDNGMVYDITRPLQKYRMSSRKSDGSGMRYIVQAVNREEQDSRIFRLMLEDGGNLVGKWFCEEG